MSRASFPLEPVLQGRKALIAAVESRASWPKALREDRATAALRDEEQRRSCNYPLSRWYLRPAAGWLASQLAVTPVRPWHVTLCGLLLAAGAAVILLSQPALTSCSALLVLGWWFCDRTDGQLARRQRTATELGAWLDANLDELVDLGLHVAVAASAAAQGSRWAWPLLIAFVVGKYLLMHGLTMDECRNPNDECRMTNSWTSTFDIRHSSFGFLSSFGFRHSTFRTLYHLPGNADVRAHLLVLALLTGWFTAELALIAMYYNLRWIARYALVIGRAGRQPA
jgi:phosphatidylglycerophosphate synthase